MNSQFKHFLITRFNLPNKGWQQDKNNNPVQNEEWLDYRIQLFETYCLPSIMHQTCKDFVWFVYFDVNSPDFLLHKIAKWQHECENFIPQYSNDYDACLGREMFESYSQQPISSRPLNKRCFRYVKDTFLKLFLVWYMYYFE